MITDVEFDSLAAEKGILPGRIVTHVNDEARSNPSRTGTTRSGIALRSSQPVKIDVRRPRSQRREPDLLPAP